ncbi:MAG: hypothetical protein D6679_08175 [Candidatus Hydrogenedentota bacterium]|nr:MAG: hypothetical protein D6679_08175 [Candidatus Hydrogenedentota bacterium]
MPFAFCLSPTLSVPPFSGGGSGRTDRAVSDRRRPWKEYLKGIYDEFGREYHFLVLGSGRLDISRRGGESLAGREFSR